MFLIYEPAGADAERYDLDDLSAVEAEAVERATGKSWGEVEEALQEQSPTALRAVLWVWHKRKEPTLRYANFDVPGWRKRLRARLGADEVARLVEAVNRAYADNDTARAAGLRELEAIADDPDDVHRAASEGQSPKEEDAPVASESGGSATAG